MCESFSMTFVNKARTVDTCYQITYNGQNDSFMVAQLRNCKSAKAKVRVLCSSEISLGKIVDMLHYNRNCSIITLIPSGSGLCYDFDRAKLVQWINNVVGLECCK